MLSRRAVLAYALAAPASAPLFAPAIRTAQAQARQPPLSEGQPFSRQALLDLARDMARAPYQPPRQDLPRAFAQLTPEQLRQIQYKPDARLWLGENRGFSVEMLHPGGVFTTPVQIRTVEGGVVRERRFSPDLFDYGNTPAPPADAPFAFSGFRALGPVHRPDGRDAMIAFQGATVFRALAANQVFGLQSRGLLLNLGEPQGEEFPLFRAFWIERPQAGATTLIIHGLIDSESVAGVCRLAVRPGDITVCDVELMLAPRVDLGHAGIAPLSGNFLFAAHDRVGVDDTRGAVHDLNGLQVWNGAGEWLWRPVHNPETLQISAFVDQNPKGFGLLQRDRRFETYLDLDNRFERRPSVWIEPLGDWGPGQVQLIEIPVNDEVNRNVIAYWRPRQPLARGAEHMFTYRMHWCWTPPERPPGAWASGLRIGRAPGAGRRRRFAVDFTAEEFIDPARGQGLRANLSNHRGRVGPVELRHAPEARLVRATFDLDPENNPLVELRLVLERDGQAASETWLYRWTP